MVQHPASRCEASELSQPVHAGELPDYQRDASERRSGPEWTAFGRRKLERLADSSTQNAAPRMKGEAGGMEFRLATQADDEALRHLLAATPMPGRISVSFRREPSYFDAAAVEGPFRQTIVACDRSNRRIVGVASRSVRDRFVNGQRLPVGYLSGLRILPEYRNHSILARGYRFLRELHDDGRTEFYLTTIVESNRRAVSVLTSGRAGLPRYTDAGAYHTLAVPVARRPLTGGCASAAMATRDDLDSVLEFIAEVGRTRQWFPCYSREDFLTDSATFRNLDPCDLILARSNGRVVGVLGGWDQNGFRQHVVERYSGVMKRGRPIYNLLARLRGRPGLPAPGQPFRYMQAALPLVRQGEEDVFVSLLHTVRARAAQEACDFVLVGLHESDSLLPVARKFATTSFVTRLYHVSWDGGTHENLQADGRVPYLESGCL